MGRTGIFGGSFNPVHGEHISLAEAAIKFLKLDRLIVMPTYKTPAKNTALAPNEDRLNMLKEAFKGNPKVEVSDFEIVSGGTSYSYITCEHLKKTIGGELFFIVGADMLKNFKTWKYPERILSAVTLVAAGRQEFFANVKKEREYFKKEFKKDFLYLPFTGKDVSSTRIRIYNSLALDISAFTPKCVCDYLEKNKVYAGGEIEKFVIERLPEKRRIHTAEVAITALKKAKELNLDEEKVKTAAILHDCAKYEKVEDYKDFTLPSDLPQPVVHAFLGAHVAEKVLKVSDGEIIDAVKYHTSGKANMTTLGKLIFVADMVERGRDYDGVEYLRALYEGDLDACFKECLKEEVAHLLNKRRYIYVETINAYEYYINQKGN